jgi:hypothetical protein
MAAKMGKRSALEKQISKLEAVAPKGTFFINVVWDCGLILMCRL